MLLDLMLPRLDGFEVFRQALRDLVRVFEPCFRADPARAGAGSAPSTHPRGSRFAVEPPLSA